MPIAVPVPQLQIDFAFALEQIQNRYLQKALRDAVATLDITVLDKELARLVPGACLAQLASRGLRGELMFAVPALLKGTPRLLGYYRLLLGFSQKAFYTHQFGLTTFKSMETRGSLLAIQSQRLDELCAGLIASAAALLEGIGVDRISRDLLGDLVMARRESPSTNRFYRLSQIDAGSGAEFIDFRQRIVSYTGIPSIG